MKKSIYISVSVLVLILFVNACNNPMHSMKERTHLVDTIGFAQYPWQIDSLVNRISQKQGELLKKRTETLTSKPAKAVVSPHDDYTYVGYLYPATLSQVKAKTVILFGVAHKAAKLHLENQLIFDSFDAWKGPYGSIKVSSMREKLMKRLPKEDYQVNDSMQSIEHSVEAELPWLQHYNPQVQIVSILVPAMPFERMEKLAKDLSQALEEVAKEEHLEWGKDYAFVISTDAVHYGDEGWGGKNFAFYGTECTSYKNAKGHEMEILHDIAGYLSPGKIHDFCRMTVKEDNFREYKWTWCGRYSVPFGLLTVNNLNESLFKEPLKGQVIGYSSSIEHEPIPVDDLRMGVTAPANDHHWVGYAAIKYN